MAQQIEIEFKNVLTKEQYYTLLDVFKVNVQDIHHQANHYFDTPDFLLKTLSSGLRIRQIKDYYECTLKEKTGEHEHLETTDPLTKEQAEAMLKNKVFSAPSVKERLALQNIDISTLHVFGTLATDRIELPYKGGLLVLDHSFYLQHEDYEVEYETNDVKIGKEIFDDFLHHHGINKKPAKKKIARFMEVLTTTQSISHPSKNEGEN